MFDFIVRSSGCCKQAAKTKHVLSAPQRGYQQTHTCLNPLALEQPKVRMCACVYVCAWVFLQALDLQISLWSASTQCSLLSHAQACSLRSIHSCIHPFSCCLSPYFLYSYLAQKNLTVFACTYKSSKTFIPAWRFPHKSAKIREPTHIQTPDFV